VGCVYEILAKVLAARLRKVVGKIISSSQHAIIHGCQILDAALSVSIPTSDQINLEFFASLTLTNLMTMFLWIFLCFLLRKWASLASGEDGFSFVSLPFTSLC